LAAHAFVPKSWGEPMMAARLIIGNTIKAPAATATDRILIFIFCCF
jgi:hypothetical protein